MKGAPRDGYGGANSLRSAVPKCPKVHLDAYDVLTRLRWRGEDSANPDSEVLGALRPAMVTVPALCGVHRQHAFENRRNGKPTTWALLLCASSPQSRKGLLWESYHQHFGKDQDPVLVWQAPTRTMNPSVPQREVDEALENDPGRNHAEYLAEWRTDLEGFVSREAVESCIDFGLRERPPMQGVRYSAFNRR